MQVTQSSPEQEAVNQGEGGGGKKKPKRKRPIVHLHSSLYIYTHTLNKPFFFHLEFSVRERKCKVSKFCLKSQDKVGFWAAC